MSNKLPTNSQPIPVFDGHNDVLLRLMSSHQEDPVTAFLQGPAAGQMDLPRIRQGGLAGGLFATYVPSPKDTAKNVPESAGLFVNHGTPSRDVARNTTFSMISTLLRIEVASAGQAKICRSVADIRHCMATGTLAMVMHIEGAEALDPDLELLEILHAAGLRTLGPLWSRPIFLAMASRSAFPLRRILVQD